MHDHSHGNGGMPRRMNIGWLAFAAVAGFYLWIEHRAHLFGVLPFLLLLACPLMHLFMHHGHGHDGKNPPSGKADGERT